MYDELKEFGLSDNEIEIYICLLKTGTSNANKIAKIIGMKRTTTYDNLSFLMSKGIVSTITKDKVQYFEASDPENIIALLEEKKGKINKIVPELKRLKGQIKGILDIGYK